MDLLIKGLLTWRKNLPLHQEETSKSISVEYTIDVPRYLTIDKWLTINRPPIHDPAVKCRATQEFLKNIAVV